jgi:hypothetical protein
LTVHVFVFFVLSLSALLLAGLSALLTGLALLALLSGLLAMLSALLTGLSALLSVLFHIVCHLKSPPFEVLRLSTRTLKATAQD